MWGRLSWSRYVSEVRWLSKGNALERFFNLWNIIGFFKSEPNTSASNNILENLQNNNLIQKLAFLTDITLYLNRVNLKLQGKNKNIVEVLFIIDFFIIKLEKFRVNLQKKRNDWL